MSHDRAESLLRELIAFETVSACSNLALCSFVAEYLNTFGIATRLIRDGTGFKASILVSIGDANRPGVVLSAHTDVVPVTGQLWSSPPFIATSVEGSIVGRGATDMKGFIAAALASVRHFQVAALETPIHLAFSYDEEIGCRGAPALVEAVATAVTRPGLCIVGEPTGLRVGRTHKGKVAFQVRILGRGGHSAMPHRAASALDAAIVLANGLRELAVSLEATAFGTHFDPSYSTLHIGSLHSGDALNLIPDEAVLSFELRFLPDEDVASLKRAINRIVDQVSIALKTKAPEARIVVEEIISYPALDTPADDPAVRAVAGFAQADAIGIPLSFGTEGGLYAAAGIPTVICGPGDIARAHKADEWIGRAELGGAVAMMGRLAEACRQPIANWLI